MAMQALFDIGNVFIEPSPTFTRLKAKGNPWLPMVLLIVLSLAVMVWWVQTVDFTWLREHMIASQPDAKPEVREAMAHFVTPTSMLIGMSTGAVLGALFGFALYAGYYLLAGKVLGTSIGYSKWFGFAVWTSIPRLLGIPLAALQIMTSHGRLAPDDMNMVSLKYLVFHLPLSNHWANLLNNLDLTGLWCIVLAAIGLKAWTGRSTGACVLAALLPNVIFYGLWAAKIAFIG